MTRAAAHALVADPLATPAATSMSPRNAWRAKKEHGFARRYGDLAAWQDLPLDERLAAPTWVRNHVATVALTTGRSLEAGYVLACRSSWGTLLERAEPAQHKLFYLTGQQLGFSEHGMRTQWRTLAKICAVNGTTPNGLTFESFTSARRALLDAAATQHEGTQPRNLTTPIYGLEGTLASFGIVTNPRPRPYPTSREDSWRDIAQSAPELAATMRAYLQQIALSLRPSTVELTDTSLRTFAKFLRSHHSTITRMRDVTRKHIETYKTWLPNHPGYRGQPKLSTSILSTRIAQLRACFDRIIEWGWNDAPTRNPIFAGDRPIVDEPLPRFLDDAAASKLLTAAKENPDMFARLAVTLLARTGMRKGELLALEIDAITQIGQHHWLRIPIGKLHNDRYIPLHPTLKTQLDEWLAQRPAQPSKLMFTHRGRAISPKRVDKAVRDAAHRAGIGHVTPHQLRHTLATQAINRGMSLEAIAALLGHKDLKMTLKYARIADHNVANEYFHVTNKIEALYQHPTPLPANLEGTQMRQLRTELNHRLLGNGYCTRPPELDCRFESLCERCVFYQTNNDFRDILTKQHHDATSKGQHDRCDLFHHILQNLDEPTP